MFTLVIVLLLFAGFLLGVFAAKADKLLASRRGWTIEQYKRTGFYFSRPEQRVEFISLRLRKGMQTIQVNPERDRIGVDPARDDFEQEMDAYREKARAALTTVRVNERLLLNR